MQDIQQTIAEISAALDGNPSRERIWAAHQKSMALQEQLRALLVNRSCIGHLDRLGRTEISGGEKTPYLGRQTGSNFE